MAYIANMTDPNDNQIGGYQGGPMEQPQAVQPPQAQPFNQLQGYLSAASPMNQAYAQAPKHFADGGLVNDTNNMVVDPAPLTATPVAEPDGVDVNAQKVGAGGWNNIQGYLKANAYAPNALSSNTAAPIQALTDSAGNQINQSSDAFAQDVIGGIHQFDPKATTSNLDTLISSPYTGPTDYASSTGGQAAQQAVTEAQNKANLTNTTGGQTELLNEAVNTPNTTNRTTTGGLNLDQFLMGNATNNALGTANQNARGLTQKFGDVNASANAGVKAVRDWNNVISGQAATELAKRNAPAVTPPTPVPNQTPTTGYVPPTSTSTSTTTPTPPPGTVSTTGRTVTGGAVSAPVYIPRTTTSGGHSYVTNPDGTTTAVNADGTPTTTSTDTSTSLGDILSSITPAGIGSNISNSISGVDNPTSTESKVGGAIGGLIGGPIGAIIGAALGQAISNNGIANVNMGVTTGGAMDVGGDTPTAGEAPATTNAGTVAPVQQQPITADQTTAATASGNDLSPAEQVQASLDARAAQVAAQQQADAQAAAAYQASVDAANAAAQAQAAAQQQADAQAQAAAQQQADAQAQAAAQQQATDAANAAAAAQAASDAAAAQAAATYTGGSGYTAPTGYGADGMGPPSSAAPAPSSDTSSSESSSSSSSSSGGGSSGSSRVICTHFYQKGEMSRDMWKADLEYTFKHLSPTTVRGYQYWAIPYVKLMRKSKLAEDIMRPVAMYRAKELMYQMGKSDKGSLLGKFFRVVFEPACYIIGLCVGEQDWQSLWVKE